jgi:hypothetical protein
MDLSWAFDTPLQELLNGHPNDQHRLPLCALAKALVELASDKGIIVLDHTLIQILQRLEERFEDYRFFVLANNWRCEVTKIVMGGSDILIRVAMAHATETRPGWYAEESLLALRLRTRSDRVSTLDRGITFAVCFDCGSTDDICDAIFAGETDATPDAIFDGQIDEMLDSSKTTVSCIIAWCQREVSIER